MDIVGIGSLGSHIPKQLKPQRSMGLQPYTAAHMSQYLLVKFNENEMEIWANLNQPAVLFLVKLFFYTGQWKSALRVIAKTEFMLDSWHFILLVNCRDVEKASKVFPNLVFPSSLQSPDDWEISGWLIDYYDLLGQKEEINNLKRSLNLVERLDSDISRLPDEVLIVLNNLGYYQINQNNYSSAKQLLKTCKKEAIARNHIYWEIRSSLGLARIAYQENSIPKALNILQQSLNRVNQLQNHVLLVRLYNNLGACYRDLGSYDTALEYYHKATDLDKRFEVPDSIIKWVQANKADILALKGNLEEAKIEYLSFLEYRQELKDSSGILFSLNKLGILDQDLGNLDEALAYFQEGLELAKSTKNIPYQAIFLNNSGRVQFQEGLYNRALSYYLEAIEVFKELKNRKEEARVNANIATTYYNMGEFYLGKKYAVRSVDQFKNIDDKRGQIYSNFVLVDVYLGLGNYHQAKEICSRALTLAENVEDTLQVAYGYGKLGEVKYYLSDNSSLISLDKGMKIYEQHEAYNVHYAQSLFFKLQILANEENHEEFHEALKHLNDLENRLKSNKLNYYIQYGDLLSKTKNKFSEKTRKELERFIQDVEQHDFFDLFIKGNFVKMQYYIKNKAFLSVIPIIKTITTLAQERNLIPLVAQSNYMNILLNYYQFSLNEALDLVKENLTFCKNNKLPREINRNKELENIIEKDFEAFNDLYGTVAEKDDILIKKKVKNFSEKLIQAFVNNELRIYIPERSLEQL